jgi:crotonobetainyl-CoA:carnitine CoA-transferase CaiB-like acyl-CoA transferase
MAGILEGIRVLDFGRYIGGPFAATLLGDMGAEVSALSGAVAVRTALWHPSHRPEKGPSFLA